MGIGTPPPEVLLRFGVQLVVILVAVRLLGAVARRLGQPAVVGELAAGVVLGPSLLGLIWPQAASLLGPSDPSAAAPLAVVGWLGVVLLVLLAGLETDLGLVLRMGRAPVTVLAGTLVVPFAGGFGLAYLLPDSVRGVRAATSGGTVFALFIAVTLAVSALPVITRILADLGLTGDPTAQLVLVVAMAVDALGWLALGVVTAAAHADGAGTGALLVPLGGLAVLVVVVVLFGLLLPRVLRRWASAMAPERSGRYSPLAFTVVVALLFAVLAQAIGSEAVLGAFLAGIALARSPALRDRIHPQLSAITLTVLAPVFFVVSGMRVDLTTLASVEALVWAAGYIAVAIVAKLAGTLAGGLLGGLGLRRSTAAAFGLNCRGAVEIVVASAGLSAGILSVTAYTTVVLMALVTTATAAPVLRRLLPTPAATSGAAEPETSTRGTG